MMIDVGDIVVCVDDSPLSCCSEPWGCKAGRAYRVIGATPVQTWIGLVLEGVDMGAVHLSVPSYRFRKLNNTADDAELIERIRNCQPAQIPDLPLVTTTPRGLDYRAWGFGSQEEMDAAFAAHGEQNGGR